MNQISAERQRLDRLVEQVQPVVQGSAAAAARRHLDGLAKPPGALGRLEELLCRLAAIQGTPRPQVDPAGMWLFAADHGIAADGVTAWPQNVTAAMLATFAAGEGAINQLCQANTMGFTAVDAGVLEAPPGNGFVRASMGPGTRSFLREPAMTLEEVDQALLQGADLLHGVDKRVVGFGDMGLGNTSAATCLTHALYGIPLADCVGPGAGLDAAGLQKKRELLEQAVQLHGRPEDPRQILSCYGGFEIAMITGATLEAAAAGQMVLVDGFIATSAVATAIRMQPAVQDYCLFTHTGAEPGHRLLLETLGVRPLMNLDMRLGEGAGCPLAMPLLRSAIACRDGMADIDRVLARTQRDTG